MQTRDLSDRLVVCAGASIVRGSVSFNFVDLLKRRLGGKGFQFMNAGVNGDLAYSLLQRFDPIVNLQPDFVTILIGTNDVIATTSRMMEAIYRWTKRLPRKPTLESYREDLENIVGKLQERTQAKTALLSLPVLGEDLSSEPNRQVARYNDVIRQIAEKYSVAYLPVNERQVQLLQSIQSKPGRAFKGSWLMIKALLRRSLLRQSLDKISEKWTFLDNRVHPHE